MAHDVFESISQRSRGAEDEENRRIQEIADELYRRCCLYEAQLRESQDNVRASEVERRVAEAYAKEHELWLPINKVFDLGRSCNFYWIATYMAALGFSCTPTNGRYTNGDLRYGIYCQEMY